MDTAEDMRKHLNARPHDGTPNARLKRATQILKLTPPCGDRLVYVSQTMHVDAVSRLNSRPRDGGRIGLCAADHVRGRTSTHAPHGANNFFHLRRLYLRPA